jgi:hypothetical protein
MALQTEIPRESQPARTRRGVSFRQRGGGVTYDTPLLFEKTRGVEGVARVGGGISRDPCQAPDSGEASVVIFLKEDWP